MKRGMRVAVENSVPMRWYVRLAVDYANLETAQRVKVVDPADPIDSEELRANWRNGLPKIEAGAYPNPPTIKLAACLEQHTRARDLLAAAAGGVSLSLENNERPIDTLRDQKRTLALSIADGSFDGWPGVPNADLAWFIAIGRATLFDNKESVCRKTAIYSDVCVGSGPLIVSGLGYQRRRFGPATCQRR